MFATYHAIVAAEEYPECQRVLAELEDSALKNLVVTLDWQAHERAAESIHTPEERLESIVQRMLEHQDKATLQRVAQGQASDDDALAMVKRAIQQKQQQLRTTE